MVGIGASAGGLEAFTELLKHLPGDIGMGFVLVQHLDPEHESALTEILARHTPMPVREVTDGTKIESNHVYIIAPGKRMTVENRVLMLEPRGEGYSSYHTIDAFFGSLAADCESRCMGVVLSGTANDGTVGLEEIKAAGGITFAQDERSAAQPSMPRNAVASGCVDYVMPPSEIAEQLTHLARHPFLTATSANDKPDDADSYRSVKDNLRRVTGLDLDAYKDKTLHRRVQRRMAMSGCATLADYAAKLKREPEEAHALYQDFLIHVTGFFRNPTAFDEFQHSALPALAEKLDKGEPLRCWSVGCSTGQEPYSIAMAFVEFCEDTGRELRLQVFATDINEKVLAKARAGFFPKSVMGDVSPERLKRFFDEVEDGYQVKQKLRDMVIFARQNVLADPPFSRLDLVVCRNMLIYFDRDAQKEILPMLHYALKPGGMLWLGESENVGAVPDGFTARDKKHRFFTRDEGRARVRFPLKRSGRSAPAGDRSAAYDGGRAIDLQREADRAIALRYAPAAVLVDESGEVVQFRGETGPFLKLAPGKPTTNLLKMLREGLLMPVRAALGDARKKKATVRREDLQVGQNGRTAQLDVEVIPLRAAPGHFLVVFETSDDHGASPAAVAPLPPISESESARNRRLLQELADTRDYLRSVIERADASGEELLSTSEEAQAANEELQSSNEELETWKEELQAANEELQTLNEELHNRNREVNTLGADLFNLVASIDIPIVVLNSEQKVRRSTAAADRVLNVSDRDIGRSIHDIRMRVDLPELLPLIDEVNRLGEPREHETQDRHGHWYALRVHPYKIEDEIDGVVVALIDMDAQKRAEAELRDTVNDLKVFAYSIDHDMRTPIRGLRSVARRLRAQHSSKLDAEAREYLRQIDTSATRLEQLLRDVSIYAHLLESRPALDEVDLDRLARELIVTTLDWQAPHADVRIVGELPSVLGSEGFLHQCLTNLIGNAVKFVGPGVTPVVRVSAERDDDTVRVWVDDNGVGVALERRDTLFNVEDRGPTGGGVGMGLNIVRKAAERMNGKVGYEPKPRGGSRFWIELKATPTD
ncbi:MAG: chemotaxis protein CheB [Gammaproteobacteria bacterium]